MTTTGHVATRTRVVVASEQSLTAESVRVALCSRGYDAMVVRWPLAPGAVADGGAGLPMVASGPRQLTAPPDVALMLSDLDRPSRVSSAQLLVTQLAVPWVVLAGVPRGREWGAMLDCGAAVVMATSITLDELEVVLGDVAVGRPASRLDRQVGLSSRRRRELVREWRAFSDRREAAAAGLSAMTAREQEVLGLLYAGESVRTIAVRFAVTEATVRSQVKAVLRKLDVSSQLAAVAAFGLLQDC